MAAPPDTSKSYVFLSFTTPDRDRVLTLADRLDAAGITFWVERPNIVGGNGWDEAIVEAIHEHNVEPLMYSPAGRGIAMLHEATTVAAVMTRLVVETRDALDRLAAVRRF